MSNLFLGKKAGILTAGMVVILIAAMIIVMISGSVMATDNSIKRLAGANRWATSANVALEAYPAGSDNVIIARGDDDGGWADGLAGGYLAGVLDAPILLTAPDSLPDTVSSAIGKLGAQKAYILGGTGAVSGAVESELEALGLTSERISGANRESTAAQIASMGQDPDTAFIVQGRAPADSMVAGAAAFAKGYPILLVEKDEVPLVTATAIVSMGVENLIIVGGTGVVSAAVATELGDINGVNNVKRLSGADRVATSVAFAKEQFPDEVNFSIVNGWRGLADAVGAAVFGNPILYVNSIPDVVQNYLNEVITPNSLFYIFGGTAVVSDDVAVTLKDMIDDSELAIMDGVWIADSPQIGEQAVVFHVQDGKITKVDSPLKDPGGDPYSLSVRFPYPTMGFTTYTYQDLTISPSGKFHFTSGTISSPFSGKTEVSGTFTSSKICVGISTNKEQSTEFNRNMTYEWTAYHESIYGEDNDENDVINIKDGVWYGVNEDYEEDGLKGYVEFYVKDNTITDHGSTLYEGKAVWLSFNYSGDPDALDWFFAHGTIDVIDNEFELSGTFDDGKQYISFKGLFEESEGNIFATGFAEHKEYGVRDMNYNWIAFHESDLDTTDALGLSVLEEMPLLEKGNIMDATLIE